MLVAAAVEALALGAKGIGNTETRRECLWRNKMTKHNKIYKTEVRRPKFRRRIYTDRYTYDNHTYVSIEDGEPCFSPVAMKWRINIES